MNNAKIWLVVKPTVGVPLFLSAVAIGSFAVHVAVLTNTSWLRNFLQGRPLAAAVAPAPAATTAAVTFDRSSVDAREATVTLSDGRSGRVVFDTARPEPRVTALLGSTN